LKTSFADYTNVNGSANETWESDNKNLCNWPVERKFKLLFSISTRVSLRHPFGRMLESLSDLLANAYSLSKLLGEEMAKQFCRWDTDCKIIGLRFSNIIEPSDYSRFSSFASEPASRKRNLWGYIDRRDAAQATRKSLTSENELPAQQATGYQDSRLTGSGASSGELTRFRTEPSSARHGSSVTLVKGADKFIIANADTVLAQSNIDLLGEFFPLTPLSKVVGANETLLSIDKGKRLLGYAPQYSCRDRTSWG
jgi:hypothetical protein